MCRFLSFVVLISLVMASSANGQGAPPLFPGQTAPSSLNQGINIAHPSPAGTATGPVVLNQITAGTQVPDQINAGQFFVIGAQVAQVYGGGNTSGGREAIAGFGYLVGPTLPNNPNRNYVTFAGSMEAMSDDGGTPGNPKGALFTYGGQTVLCGTEATPLTSTCNGAHPATNMLGLSWAEANISAHKGSSVWYKNILSLVGLSDDAVQGTGYDGELVLSNEAGAVGFKNGILFSDPNGQHPLAQTGCAICSQGAARIWSLLDFSSYTIDGWYFNLQGYQLDNFANDIGTEYGNQTAATFPYFDWHSAGGNNDYDFRFQAVGGVAGSAGRGSMQMVGGTFDLELTQNVVINGQVGWSGACRGTTIVSHGVVTGCQ